MKTKSTNTTKQSQIVLNQKLTNDLEILIANSKAHQPLINKILCYGASGTGKTTFINQLAKSLKITIKAISFNEILNLNQWFDQVNGSKIILVIDQLEQIYKDQQNNLEIINIKTNILKCFEQLKSPTILICSSTLINNLDTNLLTKIDYQISFDDYDTNHLNNLLDHYQKHYQLDNAKILKTIIDNQDNFKILPFEIKQLCKLTKTYQDVNLSSENIYRKFLYEKGIQDSNKIDQLIKSANIEKVIIDVQDIRDQTDNDYLKQNKDFTNKLIKSLNQIGFDKKPYSLSFDYKSFFEINQFYDYSSNNHYDDYYEEYNDEDEMFFSIRVNDITIISGFESSLYNQDYYYKLKDLDKIIDNIVFSFSYFVDMDLIQIEANSIYINIELEKSIINCDMKILKLIAQFATNVIRFMTKKGEIKFNEFYAIDEEDIDEYHGIQLIFNLNDFKNPMVIIPPRFGKDFDKYLKCELLEQISRSSALYDYLTSKECLSLIKEISLG